MPPRAVILDIDGTLVDSNDAHAHAWVEALAEAGRPVPFERVRPLIGMGGDKLLPAVTGLEEDTDDGRRIGERRSEIFRTRWLPRLRPLPGAAALVRRLRDDGKRLAVATSAKAEEVKGLLRVAGVDGLIESATTSDDAERSKPDPDVVCAALARTRCPPEDVLMLGDTPYDIEAAGRAGVGVIAFRSGGWDDRALGGARAIYDHPADLLDHYADSPLAV